MIAAANEVPAEDTAATAEEESAPAEETAAPAEEAPAEEAPEAEVPTAVEANPNPPIATEAPIDVATDANLPITTNTLATKEASADITTGFANATAVILVSVAVVIAAFVLMFLYYLPSTNADTNNGSADVAADPLRSSECYGKECITDSNKECMFISSVPSNLQIEAPWVVDSEMYQNDTSYDEIFRCSKYNSDNSVDLNDLRLIEDFHEATTTRNKITSHKKEDTTYRNLLNDFSTITGTTKKKKLTFYVNRLSCEWMQKWFEGNRLSVKDLKSSIEDCKTKQSTRSIWFKAFAFEYGYKAGQLPLKTCFIDLSSKGQISASKDINDCQSIRKDSGLSNDGNCKKRNEDEDLERKKMLTKKKHDGNATLIKIALKRYPKDVVKFKCSWMDSLYNFFNYEEYLDDDGNIHNCKKFNYVANNFPQFQIGIFGQHGAGKSTFLQWLAYYGGIRLNSLKRNVLFSVCSSKAATCSESYQREKYTDSIFVYDTKGLNDTKLQIKSSNDAVEYIAEIARGQSVPVGCEMKNEPKQEPESTFGTTCWILWRICCKICLWICLMFGLIWSVKYCIQNSHLKILKGSLLVTVVVAGLWYYYPVTVVAVGKCQQDASGNYIMNPDDKKASTLHAFAFLTPYPSNHQEFSRDAKIVDGLRRELKSSFHHSFPVGVTRLSFCENHILKCCKSTFNEEMGGANGRTFLLDNTDLSLISEEAKNQFFENNPLIEQVLENISPTGNGFIEPDRILELLEDLQKSAGDYYNKATDDEFKKQSIDGNRFSFWRIIQVIICLLLCFCFWILNTSRT